MKFRVTIDLENEAFREDRPAAIAQQLEWLAAHVHRMGAILSEFPVRDWNGNRVGTAWVDDWPEEDEGPLPSSITAVLPVPDGPPVVFAKTGVWVFNLVGDEPPFRARWSRVRRDATPERDT